MEITLHKINSNFNCPCRLRSDNRLHYRFEPAGGLRQDARKEQRYVGRDHHLAPNPLEEGRRYGMDNDSGP